MEFFIDKIKILSWRNNVSRVASFADENASDLFLAPICDKGRCGGSQGIFDEASSFRTRSRVKPKISARWHVSRRMTQSVRAKS
jgi:hypothetical protein